MHISFRDFWVGFEAEKDIFYSLFSDEAFSRYSELEITSVFPSLPRKIAKKLFGGVSAQGKSQKKRPQTALAKKKRIWYTGENIRPPLDEKFDAYLSFDQDPYFGKNVYLPLLVLRLLFPNEHTVKNLGAKFDLSELSKPRNTNWEERGEFVCAFINNPEPTRLRAIKALRRHGNVDVFGSLTNHRVIDKFSVAKDYKFMLCFENSLAPGYVTEKILDAYICGTIPIYWGDLGANSILNSEAFFNYRDYSSLEELALKIASMSQKDLKHMSEQPLLRRIPDLQEVRLAIVEALERR